MHLNFVLCIFNDGKTKVYAICESAKTKCILKKDRMHFEQLGEQKR